MLKQKITLLFMALLAVMTTTTAQTIELKKGFGGTRFFVEGERVNFRTATDLMIPNQQAHSLMMSAQNDRTWAFVISGVAGGLMGYSAGRAIGAFVEPDWTPGLIGLGIALASIPLSTNMNRKIDTAVSIYNKTAIEGATGHFRPRLEVNGTRNGIGLALTF